MSARDPEGAAAPPAAHLELLPTPDGGSAALLLFKGGFRLEGDGRCVPCAPRPLRHDPREGSEPRLRPGCDFWPHKALTDVVVEGAAHAPGGRSVTTMEVSVSVAGVTKRVAVLGDRSITWAGAGPRIGRPAPFSSMPLAWDRAYGGVDPRVPVGPAAAAAGLTPEAAALRLTADHPGLYPRNPFGRGYLVEAGPLPGARMPNLEDPDDLLDAGRLVLGQPQRWWRQPLPWSLGWVHPAAFPRCAFFADGAGPWFPGPDGPALPEVARGFLPAAHRRPMATWPSERGPHPRFFQEASSGLSLAGLGGGEPVCLVGLHPTRPRLSFRLPPPPRVRLGLGGAGLVVAPRLHSVILRPAEERLELVHAADLRLDRCYVPGVHREIPLWAEVDGRRVGPGPWPRPETEGAARPATAGLAPA